MTDYNYSAVFRQIGSYLVASGTTPDQHEGPFSRKLDAMQAARGLQIHLGRDPNFILDLTNVSDDEIGEFLR